MILTSGTLALDTVETEGGTARDVPGGSAGYSAMAARLLGDVAMVGVVGEDFPQHHVDDLAGAAIDVSGVERGAGESFRWHVRYDPEGRRTTLGTNRDRAAGGAPAIPERLRSPEALFLGSTDPRIQMTILEACAPKGLVALDTMGHWIRDRPEELEALASRVHVVLANEKEAPLLGDGDVATAARRIQELGADWLVVKRGRRGARAFGRSGSIAVPAAPTSVVDPTGAGDAFAGGLVASLARAGDTSPEAMLRALAWGAALGALAVRSFSWRALARASSSDARMLMQALARGGT